MEKAYNSVSLNTDLTFIVTDNGHLCALVYNCPKCVEHGTPLNDDFKEDFTKGLLEKFQDEYNLFDSL